MPERDSFPATGLADMVDRSLHLNIARFTAGLSPAALALAYLDWAVHLAAAPGKRIGLADKAMRKSMRLFDYICRCGLDGGGTERCIEPLPHDRRLTGEPWQHWAFNVISQALLLNQPGGTPPPPMSAESPATMRTWSHSRRARCSTWSRRRTSFGRILKSFSARCSKAG